MTGDRVPQRLGKYELIEEAGRGGFSVVYKARDTSLDRIVALKVLAPHLTWDPSFAERFRREARAAAGLRHPNIVTIYEAGEENGQLYIAMEFLQRTLAQVIAEQGALSMEQTVDILAQVADALDYAHEEGIVHRDVKSSNIMVGEGRAGRVRATLMDFGLVKAMESSQSLTSMGTVLGSPEYMAPEQVDPERAAEIGPATDRYALGVVAYEMLTGRVPFHGTTSATLYSQVHERPPDPQSFRKDLIAGVSPVLLKALSKAPPGRYRTASLMVEALRRAGTPVPKPAPTPAPAPAPAPSPPVPKPTAGKERSAKRAAQTSRPKLWMWAVASVLVVALLAGGLWLGISLWPDRRSGMVSVPAGPLSMRDGRQVYVDAFWMDRTEVTNAQYGRCVKAGACSLPSGRVSFTRDTYYGNPDFDDYPVLFVDWNQARAYCGWAGKRLPTEPEWEKAACGNDGREYPWGAWNQGRCNTWEPGQARTSPVGLFSPQGDSPYGCADMAGNVSEWTASVHEQGGQVLRGGAWNGLSKDAGCAARRNWYPDRSSSSIGFRCALSGSRSGS